MWGAAPSQSLEAAAEVAAKRGYVVESLGDTVGFWLPSSDVYVETWFYAIERPVQDNIFVVLCVGYETQG